MKYKIVADSSANLLDDNKAVPFTAAPLAMIVESKLYEDNAELDVPAFIEVLRKTKNATSTACPGVHDWIRAFGGADIAVGVTITSKLSGSYNSAMTAADIYMEENPGKKVHIVDSLSTGPEMALLVEKAAELMRQELSFEEIVEKIEEYNKQTRLVFMLERLDNLARNGRINSALAKAISLLNIKIVGKASDGELEPLHKCKGIKRGLEKLFVSMKENGYAGGKAYIHHTMNPDGAEVVKNRILSEYPQAEVKIGENRGLCSYYAEYGGILVGFES